MNELNAPFKASTPTEEGLEFNPSGVLAGFKPLPLGDFKTNRAGSGKLSFSVVNSEKNGKRVALSEALFQALGQPEQVSFSFGDSKLAIGGELPLDAPKHKFSPTKTAHIIYDSELVRAITEMFSLDFSGRKCSRTFTGVTLDTFINQAGATVPIAIVDMAL